MTTQKHYTFKEHITPMREELARLFPKCFVGKGKLRKTPLAKGIKEDVIKRAPNLDPDLVARAIRDYATGPTYLECMVRGAPRIDLDGNIVDLVTEADEAYAKRGLFIREKNRKKRRERERDEKANQPAAA